MKLPTTLIWLSHAFLYALLLCGCYQEAKADTTRRLVLYFYTSADGHGLPLGTYAGRQLEDNYPDYDTCVAAGEKRLRDYVPGVLKDGSRMLEGYGCERV